MLVHRSPVHHQLVLPLLRLPCCSFNHWTLLFSFLKYVYARRRSPIFTFSAFSYSRYRSIKSCLRSYICHQYICGVCCKLDIFLLTPKKKIDIGLVTPLQEYVKEIPADLFWMSSWISSSLYGFKLVLTIKIRSNKSMWRREDCKIWYLVYVPFHN